MNIKRTLAVGNLTSKRFRFFLARIRRKRQRQHPHRTQNRDSIHIQAAHVGLVLLDPDVTQNLASRIPAPTARPIAALDELTPREIEVLRMLAEGLGNREMAVRLGISDHTVKFHISSILDKFGAATRTEAVTMGIRMGIILL